VELWYLRRRRERCNILNCYSWYNCKVIVGLLKQRLMKEILKERVKSLTRSLGWRIQKRGKWRTIGKIMHRNGAEGNYTNVLVRRWQGEEEHSWSSAKAIFITRSSSLPCMLRLPFVDICENGTRTMDTFIWDFIFNYFLDEKSDFNSRFVSSY